MLKNLHYSLKKKKLGPKRLLRIQQEEKHANFVHKRFQVQG
jgi:hypothetical protein